MKCQQEPVMIRQPSMQRIVQLLGRRLDPGVGQRRQPARIAYARNHRLDDPPAAGAHDVGEHRVQFDVGLCERLLNPLDMPCLLAPQLLAGAQQRT